MNLRPILTGNIIFRNLFPENLVQACFQQVQTIFVNKTVDITPPQKDANGTTMATVTMALVGNASNATEPRMIVVRQLQYKDGMNVLGM